MNRENLQKVLNKTGLIYTDEDMQDIVDAVFKDEQNQVAVIFEAGMSEAKDVIKLTGEQYHEIIFLTT